NQLQQHLSVLAPLQESLWLSVHKSTYFYEKTVVAKVLLFSVFAINFPILFESPSRFRSTSDSFPYFCPMQSDDFYMKRCLQLAENGLGTTYPNPLVGCVIVWKDHIIGEGWHRKSGEPHAEVNAINSVKDKSKLREATLYVNLEPCSHYGKTPPCSDLIIEKELKRVVVGSTDPNPKVAGRGIAKLRQAGIEVATNCLETESQYLNRRFFTFQQQKRPYIILKWAQTRDGFIAPETQTSGKPFWITNPYSKQLVHKWRSEEEGILVGRKTAIKDNPQLNVRLWTGQNPTRVLIDPDLKSLSSKPRLHLFDEEIRT